MSDQGGNFESDLIGNLCRITKTKKVRTSPYHLQTNGQCERFNSSTLINMLETLSPEHKSNWKSSIGALVHMYNYIHNSATGFRPYFLMYGRQPKLPIDVAFRITPKSIVIPTSSKYIQKLRKHIKCAHTNANLFQQKVECHKWKYNQQSKAVSLRMGDTVLVHVTTLNSRCKIQSRWKNREYVVKCQPSQKLPVYVMYPIHWERCSCALHRNYLFPISSNLDVRILWEEMDPVMGQLRYPQNWWFVS